MIHKWVLSILMTYGTQLQIWQRIINCQRSVGTYRALNTDGPSPTHVHGETDRNHKKFHSCQQCLSHDSTRNLQNAGNKFATWTNFLGKSTRQTHSTAVVTFSVLPKRHRQQSSQGTSLCSYQFRMRGTLPPIIACISNENNIRQSWSMSIDLWNKEWRQQQHVQLLQLCHCSFESDQTVIPVVTQCHLQVKLKLHHESN